MTNKKSGSVAKIDSTSINREAFLDASRATKVGDTVKQKTAIKKQSAIQAGIENGEILSMLEGMREGVGDFIKLSLDGFEDSQSYVQFRLLSAREEFEIKEEMRASSLIPKQTDGAYELLYLIKRLSKATQPLQISRNSQIANKIVFTESQMFDFLTETQVIALGIKYDEFISKHCPNLKTLTNEDLQQIIDAVSEVLDEQDPKLRATSLLTMYRNIDSNAIYGALIKCVTQLKELIAQMDKLPTGS